MARLPDLLRTPFGFLLPRSQREDLVAEYVIREHRQGRTLDDVLGDKYVVNNCPGAQVNRLLDRPDIIEAVGADVVAARRGVGGS